MGKRTARWAKAHRARLALTQPQLAEAADISLSTVTRLERGDPVRRWRTCLRTSAPVRMVRNLSPLVRIITSS